MADKAKQSSAKKLGSKKDTQLRTQLKKLFTDKIFRWFVLLSIGLALVTLGILLVRLRPVDFAVPLHYSTLQGFDGLGAWYRISIFGFYALLVTVGNFALAAISYNKSRISSFFLIMSTAVINLFLLIIVLTLTSHLEV